MQTLHAMSLSEIVLKYPMNAGILEKYRLDFCCGGKKPLAEACEEKGIPVEIVCTELESTMDAKPEKTFHTGFDKMAADRLADYIVYTHHAYTRRALDVIEGQLKKLVKVHGAKHPELSEVAALFDDLATEMKIHMRKEEVMLFPYIKSLAAGGKVFSPFKSVQSPIGVMEIEHEHAGDLLKKIRSVTSDYALPQDACTTYRLTYLAFDELERDLHKHVHLENHVLFPKAVALEKSLNHNNN